MKNTKYILSIGLNDQNTHTQKFDTITAYKLIENTLRQYTNGYTMYETKGGYRHTDNTYIQETSIRVELMFIAKTQVLVIANTLKTALNQESIGYEEITSNQQFI